MLEKTQKGSQWSPGDKGEEGIIYKEERGMWKGLIKWFLVSITALVMQLYVY